MLFLLIFNAPQDTYSFYKPMNFKRIFAFEGWA